MTGLGSVHHTQCWSVHLDCARAEILRLRSVNADLRQSIETVRAELAATRRQLLLTENARLELLRLAENHDRPYGAYSNGA